MKFLAILLVFFMFIFPNVLMFTVSLLVMSSSLLVFMSSIGLVSQIMLLLILIVYVGAVMILIGYVCAVSPNIHLSPRLNYVFFLPLVLTLPLFFSDYFLAGKMKSSFLVDFLMSPWGLSLFIFMIFSLFLTLLMVTSQFLSPLGPFRSSS